VTVYADGVFIETRVGRITGRWCHPWTDQDHHAEPHALAGVDARRAAVRAGAQELGTAINPEGGVTRYGRIITEHA
jgi:hypothetical protein